MSWQPRSQPACHVVRRHSERAAHVRQPRNALRGARNAIADEQHVGMFGEKPLTREELIRRIYGREARTQAGQASFTFGKPGGGTQESVKPYPPPDVADVAAAQRGGRSGAGTSAGG